MSEQLEWSSCDSPGATLQAIRIGQPDGVGELTALLPAGAGSAKVPRELAPEPGSVGRHEKAITCFRQIAGQRTPAPPEGNYERSFSACREFMSGAQSNGGSPT